MNPQDQENPGVQPQQTTDNVTPNSVVVGGDFEVGHQLPIGDKQPRKKILLLIVIVILLTGLLAGIGFVVYQKTNNKTQASVSNKATTNKAATRAAPKSTAAADTTASWKRFTNTDGGYSLKYPASWQITGCLGKPPETSFIVLLSSDPAYQGLCPDVGNKPRQIEIGFSKKSTANPDFDPMPGLEIIDTTVGGVKAKKYVTTYEPAGANGLVKYINYRLYTNGANFTMTYSVYKDPSTGKVLDENFNDFTTMIEKTVKFN